MMFSGWLDMLLDVGTDGNRCDACMRDDFWDRFIFMGPIFLVDELNSFFSRLV